MTDREIRRFLKKHEEWIRKHTETAERCSEETEKTGKRTETQIRKFIEKAGGDPELRGCTRARASEKDEPFGETLEDRGECAPGLPGKKKMSEGIWRNLSAENG